jgi:hypothetical protein
MVNYACHSLVRLGNCQSIMISTRQTAGVLLALASRIDCSTVRWKNFLLD